MIQYPLETGHDNINVFKISCSRIFTAAYYIQHVCELEGTSPLVKVAIHPTILSS
jgi:hypothetical protein